MHWNNLKPIIEKEILKANINDANMIKMLLNFHKKVNTLRNLAVKHKFSYVIENKPYDDASDILNCLNTAYRDEFANYCKINGFLNSCNVGDYLA